MISFDTIITDVDGVFTDGKFVYTAEGKVSKTFGPHDSDGIKILRKLGIKIIAITADKRGFPITLRRFQDLGVELNLVSERERYDWISEIGFDHIAYVGDGIYDAACLRDSKFGIAPANAPVFVKAYADVITEASGGDGVFLEIAFRVLEMLGIDKSNKILKELRL